MSFPTDARSYFDTQIKTIDSTLNIIDDALDDEDINKSQLVSGYKMVLGDITGGRTGASYVEEIPVTLKIYAAANRSEISNFDTLYCKGQDIKDAIVKPTEAKNQSNWSDIFFISMTPAAEATDDKLFNMTLLFTIRRDILI